MSYTRAALAEVREYTPEAPGCPIDLSDNTNLFGPPPAAAAVLRDFATSWVTRYPAPYAPGLRRAIADYAGVAPGQVATGCGSDDVIDSAIRAFVEPGQRIAYSDPTFSMIPVFARLCGAVPVPVPLRRDLDVDADGLLAVDAALVYLCAPNNPTGTVISEVALTRVLDGARGVVLLDEAYAEFARASRLEQALRRPNVLVTRTLSKAFGLAGLRVGYGIGAPELVGGVEKARGPYKVSAFAERAAEAALTRDLDWMRARVREVQAVRERFTAALSRLGLSPLPSEANFVLVPVKDAAAMSARLRQRGVQVRAFTGLAVVGDALRIGLGPWEVMTKALTAIAASLDVESRPFTPSAVEGSNGDAPDPGGAS